MKSIRPDIFPLIAAGAFLGTGLALMFLPDWIPGITASISDGSYYWLLARVGGFVAYGLLWLSVVFGLLLTSRAARRWPGVRQANRIHQDISLLALGYTFFHALILLGDHYLEFSPLSLLLPFASPYEPVSVALGQLGAWLTIIVAVSYYVRRKIGVKLWRSLHYFTFLAYLLVLLHAVFAGTDSRTPWAMGIYTVTFMITYTLSVYRVLARVEPSVKERNVFNQESSTD